MNIKKSVNVAIARAGINKRDLAALMGITPASLSGIMARNAASGKTLTDLADALNMKVSELVALGEE